MQPTLAVAALLALAMATFHSYFGERYIIMRLLRRADLPKLFGSDRFTRHTLRSAWHATSIAWIGLGAVLLWEPQRAVAIAFAASAVLALVGTRGRHLSWIVFGAIALLAWPY